jgi:predicted SprT family Zn-dependent metalloprotease
MTLFNRDTLRAAYNYLNETPPFNKWNLPDGDDVEFRVVRDRGTFGWYLRENGKHIIGLSVSTVGHTDTLIRTMAHEMVHIHEHCSGPCKKGHSRAFKRWSEQVCRVHGFDPKAF